MEKLYNVNEPANNPAMQQVAICEFETDCGHTISAMRDGLAREWVLIKHPDGVTFSQSAFVRAGTAAGAAEDIFNRLQNSIF